MEPPGPPLNCQAPIGRLAFPGLASAHESEAYVEGSALASSIGQEVRGVYIVIDYVRIAAVGEIVQTEAPGPEVVQEAEAALEMEIYVEVGGQTPSIGAADQESFFIHYAEREASPILDEVGDVGIACVK